MQKQIPKGLKIVSGVDLLLGVYMVFLSIRQIIGSYNFSNDFLGGARSLDSSAYQFPIIILILGALFILATFALWSRKRFGRSLNLLLSSIIVAFFGYMVFMTLVLGLAITGSISPFLKIFSSIPFLTVSVISLITLLYMGLNKKVKEFFR